MADHKRGRGDTHALIRADNLLAHAVGRAPVTVRTKLLIAFAGIAALLVVVALIGLRVLGQSNARVEALGTLQRRAAAYQSLQTQAQQLRQLLAIRTAQDPSINVFLGGSASAIQTGHSWTLVDQSITAALSQLGPATKESRLGFTPPAEDRASLRRIRRDFRRFSRALEQILVTDRAGTRGAKSKPYLTQAINADNDLSFVTDELAAKTRSQTELVIAENRRAYGSSRNLFVLVGVGSVLLALALGLVISRSVIGPIQRIGTRLAEIAAGDFSRHIDVTNRDELGDLASNLNRMNDELRRLYEELQSVSRHKSEFLANMSHELRTPLNAIIGFSELLQMQIAGELNDQQRAYVDDVLESGRHLLALINDILDLSKVEAGHMELDVDDVSLRTTLESSLTMHEERAARDGVALGLRLEPGEITVRADERKVRQVVVNLLSNAVKFTPPGGRIDVSALALNGTVEVAVSDTGPGISPADQARIFEEFWSAGRAEGTGLGLPLSRRLIELHGGRLWVESAAGRGTTFRFTLPARNTVDG
ncbi:MAG: ATP-binding protein [Gaiellaceae bacterium]